MDLEDASGVGDQRDATGQIGAKGGEQFLRHPAGAEHPVAEGAVADGDGVGGHDVSLGARMRAAPVRASFLEMSMPDSLMIVCLTWVADGQKGYMSVGGAGALVWCSSSFGSGCSWSSRSSSPAENRCFCMLSREASSSEAMCVLPWSATTARTVSAGMLVSSSRSSAK